jgi:hypothetical protein
LWVVVVTTWAWPKGEGCSPAATRPAKWAHVDHQVSANLVGNGAKAREIENSRIGRPPAMISLGFMLVSQTLDLVEVDQRSSSRTPYCTALNHLPTAPAERRG